VTKIRKKHYDIDAEARRIEHIENLILRFQELQSARDFAASRSSRAAIASIDNVFSPLLDSILQEIEANIDQHGPFAEEAVRGLTEDGIRAA